MNEFGVTLFDTMKSLGNALKAVNQLVPGVVVVFGLLWAAVVVVSVHVSALKMAVTVLIVTAVAVGLFAARRRFGESALALVAGLFPVLAIDWDTKRFTLFAVAWGALVLSSLLIYCVWAAGKSESIYTEAANATVGSGNEVSRQDLEAVAKADTRQVLDPIDKAEVLRIFAYRRLPLGWMGPALDMTAVYAAITRLDHESVAAFVSDLADVYGEEFVARNAEIQESVHAIMRESRVSPRQFMSGFEESRGLVLSGRMQPELYLRRLADALEGGVAPKDMYNYLLRAA